MTTPIVLILGAGANVGSRLAHTFSKNGFKVALAARSGGALQETPRDLLIKADFSEPTSIKAVFDEVKEKIGTPNVVVYNGIHTYPRGRRHPFANILNSLCSYRNPRSNIRISSQLR